MSQDLSAKTNVKGTQTLDLPGDRGAPNGSPVALILVVDDIEANRDSLARRLARAGHQTAVASSGRQALEMIEEEEYDLVLLDVLMPDMNGLAVLEKLRETYSPTQLPIILATALGDSADVVRGLGLGANDYVTKPLDFAIVKARVNTQLALKRATQALALSNERMQASLDAAARVQQAGLPEPIPTIGNFRFAWHFKPCDELAGDGLHVVAIDDRWVSVCLWDVSGHGVPAALLSVSIAHVLNLEGQKSVRIDDAPRGQCFANPSAVIARLNSLFPMERTSHFVTMIYGVLDTHSGTFKYASAGQCQPIHIGAEGIVSNRELTGLPVGLTVESPEEYDERVIDLDPGDRLYIYSDGVVEEMNSEDEAFGEERLRQCCAEHRGDELERDIAGTLEKVQAWHGVPSFSDDATLLVFAHNANGR